MQVCDGFYNFIYCNINSFILINFYSNLTVYLNKKSLKNMFNKEIALFILKDV